MKKVVYFQGFGKQVTHDYVGLLPYDFAPSGLDPQKYQLKDGGQSPPDDWSILTLAPCAKQQELLQP